MAIGKVESVRVDFTGAKIMVLGQQPAMKSEGRGADRREWQKERDGVLGVELDALVTFPGESAATAKFTIFGPVPEFEVGTMVRPVGSVSAQVWATKRKSGDVMAGIWFEGPEAFEEVAVTRKTAPSASSASSVFKNEPNGAKA